MFDTTGSRITTARWVYLITSLFVTLLLCLVLFVKMQMDAAVGIRAFVGGEGFWAKAEKEAIHNLEHYAASRDEAYYVAYRRQIQVPLGDERALLELRKRTPDLAVARSGFLQGRNHPADIAYMMSFVRRFQHGAHLSKVIGHWTDGDTLIAEMNEVAGALHEEIASGRNNAEGIRTHLDRLDDIDQQLAVTEDLFSSTLTDASRWANEVSRNLTYAVALLFVALGVGLSRPIVHRIRNTERALLKAQEELVSRERLAMLGQVAASLGHELRNPLGVMSNAVYFLQTKLMGGDESTKEYLGIIRDEIASSERIVAVLMDAVRTRPPERTTHGVAELIGQVVRNSTIPSGVIVSQHTPATLPAVRVDVEQMKRVFDTLIANAIDAMPEGGSLDIRAVENESQGTITISVRDTGSGIMVKDMARLFQPLFTTKARGIGLGLVVAKNLIEANGGRMEVQSEAGCGAVFSVTLPAADEEQAGKGGVAPGREVAKDV